MGILNERRTVNEPDSALGRTNLPQTDGDRGADDVMSDAERVNAGPVPPCARFPFLSPYFSGRIPGPVAPELPDAPICIRVTVN
ncbi:MAG TPA: hypothetical protein VGF55_10125 [Gemmataceae bacterium]